MIMVTALISKLNVFKVLPSTLKHKAGVLKFRRFEERLRKSCFRDGLVWMVGLIVEKKLRFQTPYAQCRENVMRSYLSGKTN